MLWNSHPWQDLDFVLNFVNHYVCLIFTQLAPVTSWYNMISIYELGTMWTSQSNSGTLVISVAVHICFYGRLITSNFIFFKFLLLFFSIPKQYVRICVWIWLYIGRESKLLHICICTYFWWRRNGSDKVNQSVCVSCLIFINHSHTLGEFHVFQKC